MQQHFVTIKFHRVITDCFALIYNCYYVLLEILKVDCTNT